MPVMTAVAPKTKITLKPASVRAFPAEILEIQRIKNDVAMHLLEEWIADDSGYDEMVWETVKTAIEDNRLSERSRFNE